MAAESSSDDGKVAAVDTDKLMQGSLYRGVMKSGAQSYLANLSLYPGRSELPFLPSSIQLVASIFTADLLLLRVVAHDEIKLDKATTHLLSRYFSRQIPGNKKPLLKAFVHVTLSELMWYFDLLLFCLYTFILCQECAAD
ncbi:Cofactor assembly of complex C subunit B, CCB2/CCB4 [Dillenia turbinata]|uniref:Cofactor assembly of complex C subunit B, CCB2/CCB4 n=1 Tax=Dillenia turbinata TaxID=194707 RepID=A0AAN8ZD69_9MAGN